MGTTATETELAPARSTGIELDSEAELSILLDGILEQDLTCESADHGTDSLSHDPDQFATLRGTAPCGATRNVCEKFARVFSSLGRQSISCRCGDSHQAQSISFVRI